MNSMTTTRAIERLFRQKSIPLEDQIGLKTLLAGEWAAYSLPLPTQPMESPKTYYTSQCKLTVMDWLTRLNENTVIDVDDAVTLTYEIWRIRYSLVFEGPSFRYGRLISGVNPTISRTLPESYRALLSRYPDLYLTQGMIDNG